MIIVTRTYTTTHPYYYKVTKRETKIFEETNIKELEEYLNADENSVYDIKKI